MQLLSHGKPNDIEEDISAVWRNILIIFLVTLIATVFLSIYLSGVIARPLIRLARAAEKVRIDYGRETTIPDLSNRHDEIGELSLALRDMTEALRVRMDAIESFAADVAHELKNPLTSLRSATETLSVVKTNKDKESLMQIIQHDLQRLDRLISDISHASRLDSELSRDMLERVDVQKVLLALLDQYRKPLSRSDQSKSKEKISDDKVIVKDIEIILENSHTAPLIVPAVESRLMQVFENILSNALSFSPKNGRIKIATKTTNNKLYISISDEGPGIPDNKLKTIFKRFYSERPEHEEYGNHSGLGLSICKQIISALNGEIYAENITNNNEKTTGARFTVVLPTLSSET